MKHPIPISALLAFDLETTEPDPLEARIVTAYVGVVDSRGQVQAERFLVTHPGVPIPAEAAEIHGYTDERAHAEANVTPAQMVEMILSIITLEAAAQIPLAGYNLQYDLTVLEAERQRHAPHLPALSFYDGGAVSAQKVLVLDGLVLDKAADRYRKGSRRLIDTAAHYGVHLDEVDAHGAAADAVASARIVLAMLARPTFSASGIPQLHLQQIGWKAEQAVSLQEYFRHKAPPDRRDPNAVVDGSWPQSPVHLLTTLSPHERSAA